MTEIELIDIARDAIWTLILVSAPIMMVALIVGLLISLFQALTQIQEMTLSFVPKILAVFISIVICMPFIVNTLHDFSDRMYERVTQIGQGDQEVK